MGPEVRLALHVCACFSIGFLILVLLPLLFAHILSYALPRCTRTIHHLSISSLSLFPTFCRNLCTSLQLGNISIAISFESFCMSFNLFDASKNFLHIELHRLNITVKRLTFPQIMESSPADSKESSASELRKIFMKLVSICIHELNFEVEIADTGKLLIKGGCAEFTVTPGQSTERSNVLIPVGIDQGWLQVFRVNSGPRCGACSDDPEQLFVFESCRAEVSVDYQVFSRKMEVRMNITGRNETHMCLEPFLALYALYQTEEDRALELKLGTVGGKDGKLIRVTVECELMVVTVADTRASGPIQMELQELTFTQFTSFIPDSPNRLKGIEASVATLRFIGSDAMVIGAEAKKQVFVVNEKDFVDIEVFEIQMQRSSFVCLDGAFLRWLCILNDAVDRLPSSRFAHAKKSTMNVNVTYALLSYSPDDMSEEGGGGAESGGKLVMFEFANVLVRKECAAYCSTSQYAFTSTSYTIRTHGSLAQLARDYCVEQVLSSDKGELVCACTWTFSTFRVTFTSGVEFALQTCSANVFSVALSTSASTLSWPLFEMTSLDVIWLLSYRLKVSLNRVKLTCSSTQLIRFMTSFDMVLASVSRILSVLRSVKHDTYGVTLYHADPTTEISLECMSMHMSIGLSETLADAITITSDKLSYSSSDALTSVSFINGKVAFRLDDDIEEVIAYDWFGYAFTTARSACDVTLRNLRITVVPASVYSTLLGGLLSLGDEYSTGRLARRNTPLHAATSQTVYRMDIDSIEVLVCTNSRTAISRTAISRLVYVDMSVLYDCSRHRSSVLDDVRKYDNCSDMDYTNPSGGKLRIAFASFRVVSASSDSDVITLNKVMVNGIVCFASISHPSIVCTEVVIPLPHIHHADVHLGVKRLRRSAPSKMYGDVLVSVDDLIITSSAAASACLNATASCVSVALFAPPSSTDSRPLDAWDALSYWWHGPVVFVCARLKLMVAPNASMPWLLVLMKAEQTRISVVAGAMELRAFDLVVSVRQKHVNKESLRAKAEKTDLIVLPAVLVSCELTPSSNASFYTHHDVYLRPVSPPSSSSSSTDPYALFRTAPASLDCSVLVKCSGRSAQLVQLMLRLDLLRLVSDAFSTPNTPNAPNAPNVPKPPAATTTTTSGDESTEVTALVRSLNLHLHVEKVELLSWPSPSNKSGFLFSQERLDLQLRVARADKSYSGTQLLYNEFNGILLERLYTEAHLVDVYVKEWSSEVLNRKSRRTSRDGTKEVTAAVHRIMHATKLKVSLKDMDEAGSDDARRDDFLFTPSLPEVTQASASYRPFITSFLSNHMALAPSLGTLPQSRAVWRRSVGDDLHVHCEAPNRIHTPVRLRGKTVLAKPSEKSRKIWGLKIVDLRLLWSLPIRDSVFSYFAAYFDMFAEESVVEEEDVRIMHSNANKGGDKERAGIQDFLAELSSKKTSAMPRGVLTQIKSSKVMGPDVRARSTGRGVSRNLYRVVQDVSMQKHFLSLGPEDKADKVMAKTHTAVDISKMKSCRDLGPRALSTIRSPRGSGAFATRKVEEPRSRSPYVSSPMDSSASKPPPDFDSVPYFRIYLVDPQINFLDDKSEGSVVCCTGVSSLEGRHSLVATAFTGDGKGGDPKRKNDIRLRMDNVSAFTASTNNADGESEIVHWKSVTEGTENRALKVAVEDFRVRSSYTFWTDITKKEANSMRFVNSTDELVAAFKLEIPNLCANIESDQFYIMFNVVRNVMLAPPPVGLSSKRQKEERESTKSKRREIFIDQEVLSRYDLKLPAVLDVHQKATRDVLKVLIEEFTKDPLEEETGIARFVEIFIGGGKWILSSSDDGRPLVEAGFFGVYGTYSFNEDRSTTSLLEVQRFWAKSFNSGPDPNMKVDSNRSSNLDDKSSYILLPILSELEYCYRCKGQFKTTENGAHACVHHADDDGNEGEFREVKSRDPISGEPTMQRSWTCCQAESINAPGCASSPHVCKETMFSVRAEAYPESCIENIELTILQSLEISIFPGASYDLRVKISHSLSDILHGYFSVDTQEEMQGPDRGMLDKSASTRYLEGSKALARNSRSSLFASPRSKATLDTGDDALLTAPKRRSEDNQREYGPKQESFYFQYLRVGDVNVDVSTSGFTFNVDNYKAIVEPFVRRGEVMDWNRFVWEIEWHASWSLTVHTAASSLAKLGKLFNLNSAQTTTELIGNASSEDAAVDAENLELLLGKVPTPKPSRLHFALLSSAKK